MILSYKYCNILKYKKKRKIQNHLFVIKQKKTHKIKK